MFSLKNGEIVPGERIGPFELGMPFEDVRRLLPIYELEERASTSVMVNDNLMVWIDRLRKVVTQVLVQGVFQGKYLGKIGLGSTLTDVQNLLNATWHEDLDVYILDDAPGMCFELGDSGDDTYWDEMTAPIEAISVYPADE